MKVGDLVKVNFQYGTIIGVFFTHIQNTYGMVFIIQTPDGKFVGEKHPIRLSLMEVISESR